MKKGGRASASPQVAKKTATKKVAKKTATKKTAAKKTAAKKKVTKKKLTDSQVKEMEKLSSGAKEGVAKREAAAAAKKAAPAKRVLKLVGEKSSNASGGTPLKLKKPLKLNKSGQSGGRTGGNAPRVDQVSGSGGPSTSKAASSSSKSASSKKKKGLARSMLRKMNKNRSRVGKSAKKALKKTKKVAKSPLGAIGIYEGGKAAVNKVRGKNKKSVSSRFTQEQLAAARKRLYGTK